MASANRQHGGSRPVERDSFAVAAYRLRTLGELRLYGPNGEVRDLRRKERMLLAFLARQSGPVRRIALATLFWDGREDASGRRLLRQALFAVRRVLGDGIEIDTESVALRPGIVLLDLAVLEEAVRRGRHENALECWRGEFLPALEDSVNESLRVWLEAERVALSRLVTASLDAVAQAAASTGEWDVAIRHARRWGEAHRWDEAAQSRVVGVLCDAGRIGEATAWHAGAVEWLRDEGDGPSDTFLRLGDACLVACTTRVGERVDPRARLHKEALDGAAGDDPPRALDLRAVCQTIESGGAALVVIEGEPGHGRPRFCEELVQAVRAQTPAALVLRTSPDTDGAARITARAAASTLVPWSAAARMLAPLRTAPGLCGVSDAALAEVAVLVPSIRERFPRLPQPLGGDARLRAAAIETVRDVAVEVPVLVVADEVATADSETRRWLEALAADLPASVMLMIAARRDELTSDVTLQAIQHNPRVLRIDRDAALAPRTPATEAPTARLPRRLVRRWWLAAAAIVTVLLGATRLGPWRSDPPRESGRGSLAARTLYEAGLQAYYHRQDHRTAFRLFSDALEQDSSFAMAALFGTSSVDAFRDPTLSVSWLHRAEALAVHAPDRDRRLISTILALHFNDPIAIAHAETLTVRYPREPSGPLLFGAALVNAGRFLEGVPELRRALDLDPQRATLDGVCPSCEAYAYLTSAYEFADSIDAAIRVASEWAEQQPTNPAPLTALAEYLAVLERYDEARHVRRRLSRLRPDALADVIWTARTDIRAGDFATADAGLDYLARSDNDEIKGEALWLQIISYRNRHRYDEAWDAATQYRQLTQPDAPATHPTATPQAVVLMETGRAARAAAMFDTMFLRIGDLGRPSRTARDQAWLLTLRATALAAAGDTALLAELADSVQRLGAQSGYGRDPRLHHHIRGSLLRARGDLAGAERELRAGIFSTTAGFTRTNVELSEVLIDRGLAREAIPLLQTTLRAALDGSAFYVTRTEAYELLSRAYNALGRADSAAVFAQKVSAAMASTPIARR